jgi:transcriptional regulator GlxA family with amidase domain
MGDKLPPRRASARTKKSQIRPGAPPERAHREPRGRAPRRVLILVFPGVELLDVAGPSSAFDVAQRLIGGPGYRVEIAGARRGPVPTASGLEIVAHTSFARVRGPFDTLIVAGGLLSTLDQAGVARALAPSLARLARDARRICGVCTGAFALAEAGLLDGRRAVTHWAACEALARRRPSCRVEPDAIYVKDGPIWTSAGVTAGIDLALALIEEDLGAGVALDVARWLVMYLRRPGGQSQYSAPLAAQRAERDEIAALARWMADNLRADLSLPALAERTHTSVRHFSRLFQAQVGRTPAAFALELRLEAARRALELTGRSVKEIAHAAGFRSLASMHRAFQRSLGITPLAYRERFGVRGRPRL